MLCTATHIQGHGDYCSHLWKLPDTSPMFQGPHWVCLAWLSPESSGPPSSEFLASVSCQGVEGTAALLPREGRGIWSPSIIWIRLPTNACAFNPCSSPVFRVLREFHSWAFLGSSGKWTCLVVSCSVGLGFSALRSPLDQTSFKILLFLYPLLLSFSLWFYRSRGLFGYIFLAVSGGSRETSLDEWSFSFQLKKTTAITVYLPQNGYSNSSKN